MMGHEEGFQPKLFYHQINLEQRIPQDHTLRKIQEKIDFEFVYGEVKDTYGDNGNVSIPPPVILRLMLLLILYNVRSERELMETIPLRLDWLWFLGYDLDSEVPNHSVLSKARARWGVEAFRSFFERIVWQCVEVGLVDGRAEVITATETTGGDVNEVHVMVPLLESHQVNTGRGAETVVGDSKYGAMDNFLTCQDGGLKAHIPDLREASVKRTEKLKIFPGEQFQYDPQSDTYRCPAGNRLKPKSLHSNRQSRDYAAPRKTCAACQLREQCTWDKSGRTIKRHLRQEEWDWMREASRSGQAKRDIKTRQHLMERSYARGAWSGFDRARWRRLWRVEIQEYLIAAIQNIEVLLRYGEQPKKSLLVKVNQVKGVIKGVIQLISGMIKDFIVIETNRIRIMSLDFVRVGFNEI